MVREIAYRIASGLRECATQFSRGMQNTEKHPVAPRASRESVPGAPRAARLVLVVCFALLFCLGSFCRIRGVATRELDKDTIWTLYHYAARPVAEILTQLALPNNHPLSTLLIRQSVSLFGPSNVSIRLPALLCGLAIPLLAAGIAHLLFRDAVTTLLSLAFVSWSGGLVYYSGSARGYGIQTALILAYILLVLFYESDSVKTTRYASVCRVLFLLLPLAATLTLSPSILFTVPIVLIHLAYLIWRQAPPASAQREVGAMLAAAIRANRELLLVYAGLGAILFCWYFVNLRFFLEGQGHGRDVGSAAQFAHFAVATIGALTGWTLALPALLLLTRRQVRWLAGVLLFLVAVPLASALVIKAGPPRVYIPLIPLLQIGSAGGIGLVVGALARRIPLPRGVLLATCTAVACTGFIGLGSRVRPWCKTVHFRQAWHQMNLDMPSDAFICYPAEAGLLVRYYDNDASFRLPARIPERDCLFVNAEPTFEPDKRQAADVIQGLSLRDFAGGKFVHLDGLQPLHTRVLGNMLYSVYQLERITSATVAAPRFVVAAIALNEREVVHQALLLLSRDQEDAEHWGVLNPFHRGDGAGSDSFVLVAERPPLTVTEMLELERTSPTSIRFFRLCGGNGTP